MRSLFAESRMGAGQRVPGLGSASLFSPNRDKYPFQLPTGSAAK